MLASSSLSRYSILSNGVPVLTEVRRLSFVVKRRWADIQSLNPLQVVKITMAAATFS